MKDELITWHSDQMSEMQRRKEGWEERVLSPWESDPNDKTRNEHIETFNALIDFHKRAVDFLKSVQK